MFEKRYDEYVQENERIVSAYRRREILVDIDTGTEQELSWEKVKCALHKVFPM